MGAAHTLPIGSGGRSSLLEIVNLASLKVSLLVSAIFLPSHVTLGHDYFRRIEFVPILLSKGEDQPWMMIALAKRPRRAFLTEGGIRDTDIAHQLRFSPPTVRLYPELHSKSAKVDCRLCSACH